MNYEETLSYLYTQLPMFQRIGGAAYKAGLETSIDLANLFDNPQDKFKTIHIGGTNGKGSVSHLLAAILQLNGYKTGLYTSPHLLDFRERIRVNGKMIPQKNVVDFVNSYKKKRYEGHPSFFELTMMMAFNYFKEEKVDIGIIEVGLGGRLDSTNIIQPELSIITNISKDHIQFLGDTLEKIANEKAGIIKGHTPVVIGEATGTVKEVFRSTAKGKEAPILFAEDSMEIQDSHVEGNLYLQTKSFGTIEDSLSGDCQSKNANTVLNAIKILKEKGFKISDHSIIEGFKNVCSLTGLMGRWMKIGINPLTICDTGHNVGGMQYIVEQLQKAECKQLRIVIGFVNDKDINGILGMLPKNAIYYFTKAQIPRALDLDSLQKSATDHKLNGNMYESVSIAYEEAKKESSPNDFIFIGGSTFIVADLLLHLKATGQFSNKQQ